MISVAYACGCREEADAGLKSTARCPLHGESRITFFAASPEALDRAFGAGAGKPLPAGGLFYPAIPGMKTWRA